MPPRFVPRALSAVWRRWEVLDLYALPVKGPGPPADPARSLEDATTEVLLRMKETYPGDLDERKYRILVDRLDHPADRTLIIRDEHGEPCGYCHITTGDTEEARTRYAVRVYPHQAYLWDDHVFAAQRRRGLHAFAIARRLELIAEEGRTEALTIISRSNRASRASYAAFGAMRKRGLYYLPQCRRTVSVPAMRRARLMDRG